MNDCCHAFSPIRPLDPRVQATVVSLRKMFPTPFGGAAFFSLQSPKCLDLVNKLFPLQGQKISLPKLFRAVTVTFLRNLFFSQKLFNPYPMLDKLRHIFSGSGSREVILSNKIKFQNYRQSQIEFSPNLLISVWPYLEISAKKRNSNAKYLVARLVSIGISPISKSISELDVPQVLPILVNSASGFVEFLRANGVGAFQWPASDLPTKVKLSPSVFETANKIATNIVCLPVHQDLSTNDLDKIFGLCELWQEHEN